MDNQFFRNQFKFSPPSTQNSEFKADNNHDDDVQFVGKYANDQPSLNTNYYIPNITSNVAQMPLLLTTPPQSPHEQQEMNLPPMDMPTLRAILSNNYSGSPSMGYSVHIPCFLCKQPFSDIVSLRDHLTLHATQLNSSGVTVVHPATQQLPIHVLPIADRDATHPGQSTEPPRYMCDLCNKVFRSELCLILHKRIHIDSSVRRKKWTPKAFRCQLCKKSYRRQPNLLKHMQSRHGVDPILPATLTSQPDLPLQPTPTSSADGNIMLPSKRVIWSTKLLNAVAAANYCPAKESASKYMSPTEDVNQPSNLRLKSKPKQKYALRSPFCNPNLWVDYDNHIP